MPFKALLFATRKPGITPIDFKTHYETLHVPLLQRLAGDNLPLSHKRTYLARPLAGEDNSYPAAVVIGSQEDFFYDCITEVTFADEAAFKRFYGWRMQPGVKEVIDADEEKFLDGTSIKAVIVGEVAETVF
jgi:hypothetical protein